MYKYKHTSASLTLSCWLVTVFLFTPALWAGPNAGTKISTIVIDPGHGGNAPGAVGKFSKEKDLVLQVSQKFGKLINESFPDVKVLYTREKDESLELYKRTRFANKNKADLFISIHCNSSETKGGNAPRGFETFAMGVHKGEENLNSAKKENEAILSEDNFEGNYNNFDPNSPDAYIIFSLFQNVFLDQSLQFASKLQNQYKRHLNSLDRGVKQAGFLVLYGCVMPAVLTEIGFINNPEEEKFMASEEGQNKIAKALFEAFREYKYQVEGFNNQNTAQKPENIAAPLYTASKEEEKEEEKKTDPTTKTEIVFKVQFASSSVDKPLNSPEFSSLRSVSKFSLKGSYKYCSGHEADLDSVKKILEEVHHLGFKDAFIVVFKDGQQISTSEALRILKEQNK